MQSPVSPDPSSYRVMRKLVEAPRPTSGGVITPRDSETVSEETTDQSTHPEQDITTIEESDQAAEQHTLINASGTNKESRPGLESEHFVKWGVKWHKQPTYMVVFGLTGLILALSHHFYYTSLNGKEAGSDSRQQWAHNFGNVFAFLIVALLNRANNSAFTQYFWMVVRGRSFKLSSLDKLFSLTSDPFGFFSLEVLRTASVAVILALACWAMTLAGILPPGTLTVVPGTVNQTSSLLMPSFNWNSSSWISSKSSAKDFGEEDGLTPWTASCQPSDLVIEIATRTAVDMDLPRFISPALNSSYTLPVRAPFVQCGSPNSSQIVGFNDYSSILAVNYTYTNATVPSVVTNTMLAYGPNPTMSYFSAFDPFLNDDQQGYYEIDQYNNWNVTLPYDLKDSIGSYEPEVCGAGSKFPGQAVSIQMVPHQLWVETSNDEFLCTLGTGTRDFTFIFVDGVQSVSYGDIQDFVPILTPAVYNQCFYSWIDDDCSFMSVYMGLTNMLSGNVTVQLDIPSTSTTASGPAGTSITRQLEHRDSSGDAESAIMNLVDSSSRISLTGLDACEDFIDNEWNQHPLYYKTWTTPQNSMGINISPYQGNIINNLFTKPAWMCRNSTLRGAIEDLATNITISMMTQSDLISPNSINTTVTFFPTRNIYQYNPLPLLLSYGLGLLFTLFSILLGLYAFHTNGVIHSSSFTALIATTRNTALDEIVKGNSLGAKPFHGNMKKTRLMFGRVDTGEKVEHVAFGHADNTMVLKKGGTYI